MDPLPAASADSNGAPIRSRDATASLLATLRLASPALPIGSYAYSQGLESALCLGFVRNEVEVGDWIESQLDAGIGRLDMPLAHQLLEAVAARSWTTFERLDALHLATRETAELRAETEQTARALVQVLCGMALRDPLLRERTLAARACDQPIGLPAAFALAAASLDVPAAAALAALYWSWLENQVIAAMKLVPLGQQAGQRLLCRLTPRLTRALDAAPGLDEADWSGFAPRHAAASSRHETQYSRLFRS